MPSQTVSDGYRLDVIVSDGYRLDRVTVQYV